MTLWDSKSQINQATTITDSSRLQLGNSSFNHVASSWHAYKLWKLWNRQKDDNKIMFQNFEGIVTEYRIENVLKWRWRSLHYILHVLTDTGNNEMNFLTVVRRTWGNRTREDIRGNNFSDLYSKTVDEDHMLQTRVRQSRPERRWTGNYYRDYVYKCIDKTRGSTYWNSRDDMLTFKRKFEDYATT